MAVEMPTPSAHASRPSGAGVAVFLPAFGGGGAERVALNLCGFLAKQGLSVDLVVAQAQGPYESQVPAGVRVVDLGGRRLLAALPHLIRYLRRERPQALLSAMEHTNLVALWARGLARVPCRLVVSVHNVISHNLDRSPSWRDRRTPGLARLFYPQADGIVAVSKGVADDLAQQVGLDPSRIRVIYNPVVTNELAALSAERLSHPWFVPDAPPVILGVGRLSPQKDFGTLVEAFALVRAARPARVMILGEGEDRAALSRRAAALGVGGDFELPGFVANPYAYMSRAALLAMTSAWEGFGIVLVEAMACGTPVVSTDCSAGPSEILDGGRFGRLVPVGEALALAQAILATLEHPIQPAVLKARADDFSLDRIGPQYLDVLCPA